MRVLKASSIALTSLLLAAGCTYNQRHAGYNSVPAYGDNSTYSTSAAGQGAAAAQQLGQADRELADLVRQQFYLYGNLASLAPNIQVHAQNGTVTLTGTVPTERERKMIAAMVENTAGVLTLNDQLKISPFPAGSSYNSSDTTLWNRVWTALRNTPAIAPGASNLQVKDENGTITLSGSVPTEEDKALIVSTVRNTAGVSAVNDNLTVARQANNNPPSTLPPTGRTANSGNAGGEIFNLHVQGLSPADRTLAQRILEGLRTDTALTSLLPIVNINVADGRVVLQGMVQSPEQKRAIAAAVQQAAGIGNVIDELKVQSLR